MHRRRDQTWSVARPPPDRSVPDRNPRRPGGERRPHMTTCCPPCSDPPRGIFPAACCPRSTTAGSALSLNGRLRGGRLGTRRTRRRAAGRPARPVSAGVPRRGVRTAAPHGPGGRGGDDTAHPRGVDDAFTLDRGARGRWVRPGGTWPWWCAAGAGGPPPARVRPHRRAAAGLVYQYLLRPDGQQPACTRASRPGTVRGDGRGRAGVRRTPRLPRPPRRLAALEASIMRSAQTLERWDSCFRVIVDGRSWLEARSSPQALPDGGVLWHGYLCDVTDRKAQEHFAPGRSGGRAGGPGAGRVPGAHQPRAAHAAQRGARFRAAAVGRRRAGPEAAPAPPARPHRKRGPSLLSLINEVLDLTHIESGRLPLKLQPVDLRPVVEESLGMVEVMAERAGIMPLRPGRRPAAGDGRPPPARAVPRQPADERHQVQPQRRPGGAGGLAPQAKPRGAHRRARHRQRLHAVADEPPVRAVQTGSAPNRVRRRAAASASSSCAGWPNAWAGTCRSKANRARAPVSRCLPAPRSGRRGPPTPHRPRARSTRPAPRPAGAPRRVLYVEDNSVNVMLMQAIFDLRPGLRLEVAGTGRRRPRESSAPTPALLLLDLGLPDTDGVTLLGQLQCATPCRWPRCPRWRCRRTRSAPTSNGRWRRGSRPTGPSRWTCGRRWRRWMR